MIDSADEKKAFNEILLSSSSSLTQKLMPVDPTLLTPTPTGASPTALADALKAAVIEGMKASMPVGGTPPVETQEDIDKKTAALAATTPPVVVKQQSIDKQVVDETLHAMLDDKKGNTDARTLDMSLLGEMIVSAKLNETTEFKAFFHKRDTTKIKVGNRQNLVSVMMSDVGLEKILTNIAYGNIMNNGTTAECWTQIRNKGVDYVADYVAQAAAPQAPPQPTGGNGRKRKNNAQNKAHVDLSEISKILQKYT